MLFLEFYSNHGQKLNHFCPSNFLILTSIPPDMLASGLAPIEDVVGWQSSEADSPQNRLFSCGISWCIWKGLPYDRPVVGKSESDRSSYLGKVVVVLGFAIDVNIGICGTVSVKIIRGVLIDQKLEKAQTDSFDWIRRSHDKALASWQHKTYTSAVKACLLTSCGLLSENLRCSLI